jgi:CheY-like chemotaxis protein
MRQESAMKLKIVVLEDNADRADLMRSYLEDRFHTYESYFFDSAAEMLKYLETHWNEIIVICLDHDLELKPAADGKLVDPGTGRDVADFLAARSPMCPVVIHSTNSMEVAGMERVLHEAHWQTHRVIPFNDLDWIHRDWFRAVRRAILGSASPAASAPRSNGRTSG